MSGYTEGAVTRRTGSAQRSDSLTGRARVRRYEAVFSRIFLSCEGA